MVSERHLILQETLLHSSGEWTPENGDWVMVRVAEGLGYCLQNSEARELNVGDTLLLDSNRAVIFRASQLCELKLEFFSVQLQLLSGVLTAIERSQIEQLSDPPVARLQFHVAAEPVAQKFARLVAQSPRNTLAMRTALLHLWVTAVAGLLPVGVRAVDGSKMLRQRFRQFIGQMSEMELAGSTLEEMAVQLHCSKRHFSRLFREEFGTALLPHQIELRLQHARQMLADSNAKILNVAYESKFRHIGLFNSMFKRRFGMTPSEWRQRNFSPVPAAGLPRRAASLVAWLFLWLGLATAASAQTTPAAAGPTGSATNAVQKFKVEKYQVLGNSILPPKKLGEIFTNVPAAFGTNVTLDDIRAQLGNLQSAYRERGYVTVSVGLPPQKLTNATVKVKVTEGRLSAITVKGNNHYSTENVLRALPSLHTNMLLNSHVFQGELDAANANRDRQIYPVISPGLEPGMTELTLKVKDRFPLHARVEFNNQSTPGTPANRVAFNAEYDNLWNLEHQVGVQYTFSPFDYSTANTFEVTPLDRPLVANYSAFYRMPLGGPSSVQQQIDNSNGGSGYNEVTHQFVMPPPSGRPDVTFYASRSVNDSGIVFDTPGYISNPTNNLLLLGEQTSGETVTLNQGLGFKFSLPLPALGRLASTFTFGLDYKYYQSRGISGVTFYDLETISNNASALKFGDVNSTAQFPATEQTVQYFPLNIGLNGSVPDSWGSTFFNAQANYNIATIGSLAALAYSAGHPLISTNAGVISTNANNSARDNYFTVQAGLTREQRIYKDWTVLLHADGQWASTPLFSNEQYGMGGSSGVRGYSDGDTYGDTGWRVMIEPRTPLVNIGMVDGDIPMWVRASVFMDYGETYLVQKISTASNNSERFWGFGSSLTANIGNHLDARLTVAFPLIASAVTPAWDFHFYFGLGAQF